MTGSSIDAECCPASRFEPALAPHTLQHERLEVDFVVDDEDLVERLHSVLVSVSKSLGAASRVEPVGPLAADGCNGLGLGSVYGDNLVKAADLKDLLDRLGKRAN